MLADNANGEDSPNEFFRQYARLSLYHYQCSKASTSKEIAAVFSKASQRQEKVDSTKQKCVVFMDEAGLPEEERESLKVLHYLLEGHMSMRAPVAFVAITNHVLDAAKSNRCVTLLRQEPDIRDLITITKGLLFSARKDGVLLTPRVELDEFLFDAQEFAKRLCSVYLSLLHGKLLPEAITFFGLRDFIFFLKALRSYAVTDSSKLLISVKSLVRAIERNFNGISLDAIKELVRFFLESLTSWSSPEIQEKLPGLVRLPMDTITDGLQSGGAISDFMSRDRFKLIIDCTEDDSMMRILNHKGLLDISKKSVFKLSHSPEEVHLEKLRLISGVKFSAMQGNVAVLSQTEAVNESFYDLFNQNFRAVAGSDGEVSLFANIAVGGISRRSLVARGFQCIMQCSESGLEALPAPFLNRFEKFRLDVGDVLEAGLRPLGVFGSVLMKARQQTEYLLTPLLKLRGIFGWAEKQRTLDSIFVGILPAAPLSEEHRTAKGIIAVEDGNTLSEVILKFLNLTSSLSMTPAEIHAIIGNSIHELPVDEGNWIRKYINGVSDPHSIAQALEGTLSEPALDLQVSACLNLLQIIVTHYAVSRLMRLATPEAVFASRNELPIELLDDFFLNRFTSLKHLVGYQLEEQKQIHGTRLAVVYTRTDAAIHCFPSCPIKQNEDNLNHVTREKIVAQVSPFADEVVIERLELLRTESELRNSVVSWAQSTQKHVYVLLVDMDESKAEERVKYIRICAEQYASRTSNKVFLLLLHYPPSRTFQSSYFPAIFLGGWQHYFLDGVGQGGFELDASHALRVACKSGGLLETDDIDKLVDALERFLQEQLQHVLPRIASQQIFSVEQLEASSVGNFTETQSSLQLLLLKKLISRTVGERTIGSILCRKFSMSWVQSELLKTVQQASRGLLEGTTQLSMATSVQSTLIELFEAYLLHTLVTINRNRNADVLDRLPADEGLGELFGYILDGLHVCQREELLLYRDRRLQQRSSMTSHSKIEPRFPFFDLLSSCIEEILEKADIALKGEEEKPVGPRNSLSESNRLFTRVMEMLQEFQDTESEEEGIGNMLHYRGCLVMKVVQRVLVASQGGKAATDSLFQLYLQQFIEYKTSCTPNDVITDWILKQTHAVQAATNIVAVHCVTRCRLTDFMRLSSWTSMVQRQLPSIWEECIQDGSLEEAHGASFLRSFFYKLLNHFESTLIDGCAGNDWSKLLWSFLQQIIGLSPLEFLQDERDMFRIRILALFLILAQSQASRVIQHAALKKFYDSENKAIKVGPREVASLSEIFGSLEGDRSLEDVLFQQYFSQDWAPIMQDYYTEDFGFLVDFITSEKFEGTRGHQRAVALLFRACSAHGSEDQRFLVEGLSTRCLHILSRKITCERISDFSDAGARTSLPHFIPKWLRSERADQVGELTLASCYSTFFSYYSHSFGDDRLAEIVFDMILGILLRQAEESTSEDALLLLTRAIEAESFIDRSTQARRLRSEAHGVLLDSSVGLSLGAMICSARVICFVAKVAQELAESSLPLALSGMNRDVGLYVLQDIMSVAGVQYHSLFFSLIANHHQREGALTDLLGDGVLRDLPWCQSMREGIPSCRTEIARALTDAETALADAVNEENRKVAQFRLCPGCQQPFEVDQANCGQMRCGSDAHGVGGRPAVGGHAVGDTYGCDRLFNLGQARNYVQDEGILKPLREAVEHRRVEMLAFESAESHWRSILSFRIPNLKFSLQKQAAGPDIVPSAYLKGGGCCHEEALDLLSDASRLGDMFSLLPDLIEVRIHNPEINSLVSAYTRAYPFFHQIHSSFSSTFGYTSHFGTYYLGRKRGRCL